MNANDVKDKIARLEAEVMGRRSDPGGTRIDLQHQVKGKLPLENVETGPLVDVLKSIQRALENLEKRG